MISKKQEELLEQLIQEEGSIAILTDKNDYTVYKYKGENTKKINAQIIENLIVGGTIYLKNKTNLGQGREELRVEYYKFKNSFEDAVEKDYGNYLTMYYLTKKRKYKKKLEELNKELTEQLLKEIDIKEEDALEQLKEKISEIKN